jgi:NAD(P)-dependent dehydrogenase (short-subunit alcohol dehydrogenase family)
VAGHGSGRTALVTGAGSGIGAATARALAADGFRVWLADLRLDAAQAVADELRGTGAEADAVEADVTDAASIGAAVERAAEPDGALDVLVTSAGIIVVAPFAEATAEQWERTLRVNVVGTYLTLQAALPALRRAVAPPARVLMLASTAGKAPGPFTAPYNASKAAVINLARSAAAALAPDVVVNSICPGVIDTPMWRQELEPRLQAAGAGPAATYDARTAAVPMRRGGTADEVAALIAALAGPAGAYVLGSDVNVNGGLTYH